MFPRFLQNPSLLNDSPLVKLEKELSGYQISEEEQAFIRQTLLENWSEFGDFVFFFMHHLPQLFGKTYHQEVKEKIEALAADDLAQIFISYFLKKPESEKVKFLANTEALSKIIKAWGDETGYVLATIQAVLEYCLNKKTDLKEEKLDSKEIKFRQVASSFLTSLEVKEGLKKENKIQHNKVPLTEICTSLSPSNIRQSMRKQRVTTASHEQLSRVIGGLTTQLQAYKKELNDKIAVLTDEKMLLLVKERLEAMQALESCLSHKNESSARDLECQLEAFAKTFESCRYLLGNEKDEMEYIKYFSDVCSLLKMLKQIVVSRREYTSISESNVEYYNEYMRDCVGAGSHFEQLDRMIREYKAILEVQDSLCSGQGSFSENLNKATQIFNRYKVQCSQQGNDRGFFNDKLFSIIFTRNQLDEAIYAPYYQNIIDAKDISSAILAYAQLGEWLEQFSEEERQAILTRMQLKACDLQVKDTVKVFYNAIDQAVFSHVPLALAEAALDSKVINNIKNGLKIFNLKISRENIECKGQASPSQFPLQSPEHIQAVKSHKSEAGSFITTDFIPNTPMRHEIDQNIAESRRHGVAHHNATLRSTTQSLVASLQSQANAYFCNAQKKPGSSQQFAQEILKTIDAANPVIKKHRTSWAGWRGFANLAIVCTFILSVPLRAAYTKYQTGKASVFFRTASREKTLKIEQTTRKLIRQQP